MAQAVISDKNLTPLIQIISWFMLVVAAFALLLRAVSRVYLIRRDGTDDSLVFAAFTQYIALLLYIICICLAKLSVVVMIVYIVSHQHDRRLLWGTGGIIFAWAFAAFWVSAFQCRGPHVWNISNGQCINQTAFWDYFEIGNLLTDALLIILPGAIVVRLHTRATRKLRIMFFFGLRTVPMAATITKLVFLNRIHYRSNNVDATFTIWPIIIITQIIQGLQIFSTCCLNLPPLLEGLQSGFMHAADIRRRGQSVNDTFGYNTSKNSSANGHKVGASGGNRAQRAAEDPQIPHISKTSHNVTIKGGKDEDDWDAGSQNSHSQIIKRTQTFAVGHGPLENVSSIRCDEENSITAL